MRKIARFLIPALPILAAIVLLAFYAQASKNASRSVGWTQVVGTIEQASAHERGADVAYRYEVAGTVHRNPRGTITDNSGQQAIAARYQAGRTILVYVNPANPAESVLEHPPNPASWPLIAAPILILVGLAVGIAFVMNPGLLAPAQKPDVAPRQASAPMSRLRPPPSVKRT